MTTLHDEIGLLAVPDSSGKRSANFTHDIKDHNNSILLGTDLLHKYWQDLSAHLSDIEPHENPEIWEAYLEIVTTIPVVIAGIRNAARRIDETVTSGSWERRSLIKEGPGDNGWEPGAKPREALFPIC
jgi:hypothetical protein